MQTNILDYGARALPPEASPPSLNCAEPQKAHSLLSTSAIQAAIDSCAKLTKDLTAGGGIVTIPAGCFLSGSIFLRDNITLHLEPGAVLLGSPDPADYPVMAGRWEGAVVPVYAPLIAGNGLQNISLTGRGVIDGQGAAWWQPFRDGKLPYPRPRLVSFSDCRNVLIEGITACNSPSWTINPVCCDNVTIDKITIHNPPDSPNTDGINPDSCRNVHISNCHIDVGDDCITLKSGSEAIPPEQRTPCENITIINCTLEHGHGGVVIGSEMSGGVRNVVIANCVFVGTDRGIRLKARRGRGGVVEDIRASNLIMDGVLCPFSLNLYYACGRWGDPFVSDKSPQPVDASTPVFRRITLSHVSARRAQVAAGFVYGLPEHPIEDLTLSDYSVSMKSEGEGGYADMADGLEWMQAAGLYIRNVRRLRLDGVEIRGQVGPALRLEGAEEVEISRSEGLEQG